MVRAVMEWTGVIVWGLWLLTTLVVLLRPVLARIRKRMEWRMEIERDPEWDHPDFTDANIEWALYGPTPQELYGDHEEAP